MYQDAWKRFYVAKPRPEEGAGWLHGTQLVLMTSAGRLLEGRVKDQNGMASALREVLEDYARLNDAERLARSVDGEILPQPVPPPGGLVLTIYDRPLGHDENGKYRFPDGKDLGGFRTHAPHGQRSSLWLTAAEQKSLIPENPQIGQTHDVPTKLARRIALYGLVPQTLWVVEETWKPNSVLAEELKLTISEVSAEKMRMRVHGSALLSGPGVLHEWPEHKFIKNLENRYDARLEGILDIDRSKQKIVRWDMAALGNFSGRWFAGNNGWKEATTATPLALGFAFELDQSAYSLLAERRRPRSFMHAYIFREQEEHYWDPDKWLTDWAKRQNK